MVLKKLRKKIGNLLKKKTPVKPLGQTKVGGAIKKVLGGVKKGVQKVGAKIKETARITAESPKRAPITQTLTSRGGTQRQLGQTAGGLKQRPQDVKTIKETGQALMTGKGVIPEGAEVKAGTLPIGSGAGTGLIKGAGKIAQGISKFGKGTGMVKGKGGAMIAKSFVNKQPIQPWVIKNKGIILKSLGIAGAVSGVNMAATWLASDNIIGGASLTFRDTITDIQFNKLKTKEMVDDAYENSMNQMELASQEVVKSTMLNPLLWFPSKIWKMNAQNSMDNLTAEYNNALLALENRDLREQEEEEETAQFEQAQQERQQFQTDLQTRKEEAQTQSQNFWADYQKNKKRSNTSLGTFIQQGGQYDPDPTINAQIELLLKRKAFGLGLTEEEQQLLKDRGLWDQKLDFINEGGSALGFGLI